MFCVLMNGQRLLIEIRLVAKLTFEFFLSHFRVAKFMVL